jgi:hypothetical protein
MNAQMNIPVSRDIKKNTTAKFNAVLLNAFDDCLVQILENCKMYVACKGD